MLVTSFSSSQNVFYPSHKKCNFGVNFLTPSLFFCLLLVLFNLERYKHFLLFPKIFSILPITNSIFGSICKPPPFFFFFVFCLCFSIWTGLNFCCLVLTSTRSLFTNHSRTFFDFRSNIL